FPIGGLGSGPFPGHHWPAKTSTRRGFAPRAHMPVLSQKDDLTVSVTPASHPNGLDDIGEIELRGDRRAQRTVLEEGEERTEQLFTAVLRCAPHPTGEPEPANGSSAEEHHSTLDR